MEHPPAYKPLDDRDTPLHRPADEECGFWGEEAVRFPDDDEKSWGIRDVLCAVAYALLIVALVLNADVFLARLGVGVRVRVLYEDDRGIGGRVLVQGVGEMAEMYLCRKSAPGDEAGLQSLLWHAVSSEEQGQCEGDLVMLLARRADEVKLWSLTLGELRPSETVGKFEENHAPVGSSVVGGKEDAGRPDDLAEEGILSLPLGSHMHAGFGGPWKGRMKR